MYLSSYLSPTIEKFFKLILFSLSSRYEPVMPNKTILMGGVKVIKRRQEGGGERGATVLLCIPTVKLPKYTYALKTLIVSGIFFFVYHTKNT